MWDVGLLGPKADGLSPCLVPIPASVRTLWELRPDTCLSRLSDG
jgi:hypothetical protein